MTVIRVFFALVCIAFLPVLLADDAVVEYKVRAGYLYNFTKFITWTVDNSKTFNLCVLGDDPFAELIDPIEKLSVMERVIKVFRFDSFKSMDKQPHCHILYISSSIKEGLHLRNFNDTLVVGESEQFIDQGGMIGFVNRQGKIKLQINLEMITRSGLKISAKLLEVADVVKGAE
ncbi:YfiR family protein [Methylobacter psychrophilus]|uniref:YfiR family protein n=1 Tax=Methylobacter psychrophilus TaxID=96941 RepID=UPI0021D516AE|nr:YfiR family protein [Methylobacter psychrophilus]